MLIRGGHRVDYLIMNFGLHYSEDYKGELQTIIEQVSSSGVLPLLSQKFLLTQLNHRT